MGSVLMLWGEAGDVIVEAVHLKQPMEKVGPLTLIHDHAHGRTTLDAKPTIEELVVSARRGGLTVAEAARQIFGSEEPNAIEKARRRLNKLLDRDGFERRNDPDGTARYFARDLRLEVA